MSITERLTDQAAKQALPDLDMPLSTDDEHEAAKFATQTRAARIPGPVGPPRGYDRVAPRTLSRMVPFWVPIGCVVVGAVVLLVIRFVA
ncbi:MAG TPA: hypothetical protein VLA00_10475 [Xanthobacteraceae bacterium]|nr:hypothetical protein [Xanthobacteraceae bacterium]